MHKHILYFYALLITITFSTVAQEKGTNNPPLVPTLHSLVRCTAYALARQGKSQDILDEYACKMLKSKGSQSVDNERDKRRVIAHLDANTAIVKELNNEYYFRHKKFLKYVPEDICGVALGDLIERDCGDVLGKSIAKMSKGYVFLGGHFLNNIEYVDHQASSFTCLTYLSLQNNKLTENALLPLQKLTQLESLDLSDNNITQIPALLFANHSALRSLKCTNNRLSSVPGQLLAQCYQLWGLELQWNAITHIDDEAFNSLISLRGLNLSHNQFEALPQGLSVLTQLENLDVDQNMLTSIAPIQELHNLQFLWADNNKLTQLPSLSKLSQLLYLYLSHNKVHLTADSFKGLTKLSKFKMNNNAIQELPSGIFQDMHSLEGLKLRDNALQCFTAEMAKGLSSLESLRLSGNKLSDVCLDSMEQLHTIDLSSNVLSSLDFLSIDKLQKLPELSYLFIRHNQSPRTALQELQGRLKPGTIIED